MPSQEPTVELDKASDLPLDRERCTCDLNAISRWFVHGLQTAGANKFGTIEDYAVGLESSEHKRKRSIEQKAQAGVKVIERPTRAAERHARWVVRSPWDIERQSVYHGEAQVKSRYL
jgi:hypothetical protein